jgi:antitoxin component YwqK of YwqJK toxin-antitoxin module
MSNWKSVVIIIGGLACQSTASQEKPQQDEAVEDPVLKEPIDPGKISQPKNQNKEIVDIKPTFQCPSNTIMRSIDTVIQCEDNEGNKQGPFIHKYSNGKIKMVGRYKDDLFHGEFSIFNGSGKKQKSFVFDNGNGHYVDLHPNGYKASEGNYQEGLPEGKWQTWFSNGQLSLEGTYQQGLMQGEATRWNKNGEKTATVQYQDDRKHGVEIRYEEEKKTMELIWQFGELIESTDLISGTRTKSVPKKRSHGEIILRHHPKIKKEWQTCSADHQCELTPAVCCPCGPGNWLGVHYQFINKVSSRLRPLGTCHSNDCPTKKCAIGGVRCEAGFCVATKE